MKSQPTATTSIRASANTARLLELFREGRIAQCKKQPTGVDELVYLPTATADQLLHQALSIALLYTAGQLTPKH
jgi:hypothetical protein